MSIPVPNFILQCDSYKLHHFAEYPADTETIYSTVVPRKDSKFTDQIVAMGAVYAAATLAAVRITQAMVDEAEIEVNEYGYEFNRKDWEIIVNEFGGKLPLSVFGVEEGRVVKANTPILGIVNTDKRFFWLVSYVETVVQRIMWKMSNVASVSRYLRRKIKAAMIKSGSDLTMLPYKLHNFGDRGADGFDGAVMAAIAHATCFAGSDCLSANRVIKALYDTRKPYLSSVDATEHSVTCAHSDAKTKNDFGGAVMAVERLEEAVARTKRGIGIPLQSVVIDTYDDERFVKEFMGTILKDRILASGGVMVMRPDSGDPLTRPIQVIGWLHEKFGATLNKALFYVLHPQVRAIQGDGINEYSVPKILDNLLEAQYSVDNLTFGMGGGLTHGPGRDEFSFSMKATALYNGKEWIDLLKEPKTDSGKKSLTGLVRCIEDEDGLQVVKAHADWAFLPGPGWRQYLANGDKSYQPTFDQTIEWATFED